LDDAVAAADAVLNFAGPFHRYGPTVAAAALRMQVPYVDVCDDADATRLVLEHHRNAQLAGVPLLTGAGMSPGLVNSFAMLATQDLDEVERVLVAWVVGERGPSGEAPLGHLLHCITGDIPSWRDGRETTIRAFVPEHAEVFPFPKPIGPVEVWDIGHPEPVTLPNVIGAGEIRTKGALLPAGANDMFHVLLRLGLTSDARVRVGNCTVVAREFLAAHLNQRHNLRARSNEHDRCGFGVRVEGTVRGSRDIRTLAFAEEITMAEATAVPAVAALELVLEGAVPAGVTGPEVLDPGVWLERTASLSRRRFRTVEVANRTTLEPMPYRFAELGRLTWPALDSQDRHL
jgi:saccharopine dehydrogenase-like NADP-dependent oxidoreductase